MFQNNLVDLITEIIYYWYLQSSVHIRPSSMSLSPVGHAHEILGLRSVIRGAGKHKCEQCPLRDWQ